MCDMHQGGHVHTFCRAWAWAEETFPPDAVRTVAQVCVDGCLVRHVRIITKAKPSAAATQKTGPACADNLNAVTVTFHF